MVVKIMVRKSYGKALYAEAMEDFIDLLFSFLTIPLANVVECLDGDSSLGCVDNLFKSIKDLNLKWFATHRLPWSDFPECSNDLLLDPGLAPKFRCSRQPFQLEERTPYCYWYNKLLSNVCYLTYNYPYVYGEVLVTLTLIDPKSPNCEECFETFVKRPVVFLVSDGLVVQRSAGTTSSISFLKELNVPIDDIEEHVIRIRKHEALNLLKASLIITSALTSFLNLYLKKPKQEL
ncbi:hypothetical protein ACSBR2_034752 [Camellia fascicularis]